MSAQRFLHGDIMAVIDLQIAIQERYEKEQKISLVYFRLPSRYDYDRVFENILRKTDSFVQEGEHFIAILYNTDKDGARELLAGIQDFLDEKPLDLIVSYPKDGKDARSLLIKLQDEIKDHYGVILESLKIETYPLFEYYEF